MVGGVVDNVNRACRVIIFDVLNISAWSEVQIYYPSNHRFAQVRAEPIGSSERNQLVPLELLQDLVGGVVDFHI